MVEGQRRGVPTRSASPVCLGVPRGRARRPPRAPACGLPVRHAHRGWGLPLLALVRARPASSSTCYSAEAGGASGPWPVARGVGGRPWPGLRTLEAGPAAFAESSAGVGPGWTAGGVTAGRAGAACLSGGAAGSRHAALAVCPRSLGWVPRGWAGSRLSPAWRFPSFSGPRSCPEEAPVSHSVCCGARRPPGRPPPGLGVGQSSCPALRASWA